MAKTRKIARKSGAKKVSAVKKTAGKKKATKKPPKKPPTELDLRPLKKQIREHVQKLSASSSSDPRVKTAMSRLQRVYDELTEECVPTMTIPLA